MFERGIDNAPGGRRKPHVAPPVPRGSAGGSRRATLLDLARRQTQQPGDFAAVIEMARRTTMGGGHGAPRASHTGVRSSHAGDSRLTALGDAASGGSGVRQSVLGEASLAASHSRLTLENSHSHLPLRGPGGHGALLEQEEDGPLELSPEQLEARLTALLQTCTYTVFSFAQRGLFDRDKLIFTTLLTTSILLKASKGCPWLACWLDSCVLPCEERAGVPGILHWSLQIKQVCRLPCVQDGTIDAKEFEHLCRWPRSPTPPPLSDDLARWMGEAQWAALVPLAQLPAFAALLKDVEKNGDDWERWAASEAPESAPMPGEQALVMCRSSSCMGGLGGSSKLAGQGKWR